MVDLKISVILSVYNDENNIEESIESLLSQTYKNFELLISDDCSTDNSYEKIMKYSSYKNFSILKNEQNIGLTKSLNRLVNISKGKYIFRQDSDDISHPTRFEKQIEILENTKYQVCTTRAINKQNEKKIPGYSFYLPNKYLMKFKNPFIHGTLGIDKNLLNSLGNYDENFYYSQDYKLFTDLYKNNIKIWVIKEPLYSLNTAGNISTNKRELQKDYFDKARRQ